MIAVFIKRVVWHLPTPNSPETFKSSAGAWIGRLLLWSIPDVTGSGSHMAATSRSRMIPSLRDYRIGSMSYMQTLLDVACAQRSSRGIACSISVPTSVDSVWPWRRGVATSSRSRLHRGMRNYCGFRPGTTTSRSCMSNTRRSAMNPAASSSPATVRGVNSPRPWLDVDDHRAGDPR